MPSNLNNLNEMCSCEADKVTKKVTTSKLLLVDVALQSLRPVETFIFTVSYFVYSDEDHFVQTILDAPLEFNVIFYKNITWLKNSP